MVIGLTFRTWQVLTGRQNETEYNHTFIHEPKSEQMLVCEMNTNEKVQKAETYTRPVTGLNTHVHLKCFRVTRSFGLEDNLKDNIKVIHLTITRENTFRFRKLFIGINFIKVRLIC